MDKNRYVFNRVAEFYDTYRPSPPVILIELLIRLAQVKTPLLIVDLGSGTGLSTMLWVDHVKAVIGVEPNGDMLQVARRKAESLPDQSKVSFLQAIASQTGLRDGCADIVTCGQSFHWMEPESTLAEVARILRPGGVFAAYDYQWPPTFNWRAEQAYNTFIERAWSLKEQHGTDQDFKIWSGNKELFPLLESGHFRYMKELWLHHQESGSAERFIGLALTDGVIQDLQSGLVDENEIGLNTFKQAVIEAIGDQPIPWIFSYHVRMGIR